MKGRAFISLLLAVVAGAVLSQVALAGAAPELTAATAVARAQADARPDGFLVARVRGPVILRSSPGGSPVARAAAVSQFGKPTVFGVVRERGDWLGVTTHQLPNGKLGWIRKSRKLSLRRVGVSLHADLSERRIELRRGGRVVKRLRVSIGRPGSPTPRGRFAVTEKLRGSDYGPYYGCCILALSATQPNTPAGWKGGNRMAIHGTNAPGLIGQAVSAGCLRAADADLGVLMRTVPAGTPVFIRR